MLNHKHKLEQQLEQIESALRDDIKLPIRPRTCRQRNYGELTSAVSSVLETGPLTKREIVARLQEQKFHFGGPSLKILDSVIYTPHFKRSGKHFSQAKPVAAKTANPKERKLRGLAGLMQTYPRTELAGQIIQQSLKHQQPAR
jgi:hypothetical protein